MRVRYTQAYCCEAELWERGGARREGWRGVRSSPFLLPNRTSGLFLRINYISHAPMEVLTPFVLVGKDEHNGACIPLLGLPISAIER